MSEENISVRLKFLLQKLNISSSAFADACGISRATFSQLLTGRNKKISDVIVGQIHKAYPALSILWLLFNEGPMWVGQPNPSSANSSDAGLNLTDSNQLHPTADGDGNNNGELQISDDDGVLLPDGSFDPTNSETNPKNTFENSVFPNNLPEGWKGAKENGLNSGVNTPNQTHYKNVNSQQKQCACDSEIEKKRVKQRKVVQVTIYYDDSTFETLFPR